MKHGHFAGDDRARADAFVEYANDPRLDAVWFARGGYGSCRIAEAVIPRLNDVARKKRYLGYSDAGSLLAGMYKAGFQHLAHGPMASDAVRHDATALAGAELADGRATRRRGSRRCTTIRVRPWRFNLTILDALIGTPLEPDLTGHVLMIEDVSEPLYRIDRMMFHLTSQASNRRWRASGWAGSRTSTERSRLRPDGGGDRPLLVLAVGHSLSGDRRHRPRRRQQGGALRMTLLPRSGRRISVSTLVRQFHVYLTMLIAPSIRCSRSPADCRSIGCNRAIRATRRRRSSRSWGGSTSIRSMRCDRRARPPRHRPVQPVRRSRFR